jgi:hypothetical protein
MTNCRGRPGHRPGRCSAGREPAPGEDAANWGVSSRRCWCHEAAHRRIAGRARRGPPPGHRLAAVVLVVGGLAVRVVCDAGELVDVVHSSSPQRDMCAAGGAEGAPAVPRSSTRRRVSPPVGKPGIGGRLAPGSPRGSRRVRPLKGPGLPLVADVRLGGALDLDVDWQARLRADQAGRAPKSWP